KSLPKTSVVFSDIAVRAARQNLYFIGRDNRSPTHESFEGIDQMKGMSARYLEKCVAYLIERFLSLILSTRVIRKPQTFGLVLTLDPTTNHPFVHRGNRDPGGGAGSRKKPRGRL